MKSVWRKILTQDTVVADRFLCATEAIEITQSKGGCGFIIDPYSSDFEEWAAEARPDLLNGRKMIRCKCDVEDERLEDELKKRKRLVVAQSNLPRRMDQIGPRTFANFQSVPGMEDMVARCKQFADGVGAPFLVLSGRTGVGKTHLLEAVCRYMLDTNHSVGYSTAKGIVDTLRSAVGRRQSRDIYDLVDTAEDERTFFSTVGILAVDELGTDSSTSWAIEEITSITDKRYSDGSRTIFATNAKTPDELARNWGTRLASRIFDRTTGIVEVVWTTSNDYRLGG